MPAQSIHQHRALAYQSLPTSVQQHSGLLFSRLTVTKRIVGRPTASQIASASAASFLFLLT